MLCFDLNKMTLLCVQKEGKFMFVQIKVYLEFIASRLLKIKIWGRKKCIRLNLLSFILDIYFANENLYSTYSMVTI